MTVIRPNPSLSVYSNATTAGVKRTLADFSLCRSWIHLTVSRLGKLSSEKFQSYVRLFEELYKIAEKDKHCVISEIEKPEIEKPEIGKPRIGKPFKVITPSVAALNSINVDGLMNSPKAWQEILRVVYLPEKERIDLRELIWIQKRFRPQ